MPEDKEGLIRTYKRSREDLLAAIDGLSEAQMSEPTIDGWSVKDHLLHIANWDVIRAGEVRRISAGHDSLWKMTEAQNTDHNALSYALKKDLSLKQALWEFEKSREDLLDAINHATDRGLDGSLYGEAGLNSGHEPEHTAWIKKWRFDIRY